MGSLFMCDDRCPAPRRRADPPSLESRSSSRAGRFAGAAAVVAARAPLLCNCVVPLSRRAHTEFWLAVGTHTLSTPPSSEGPAFLGQESGEHGPLSCALPRLPSPCLCPWLCTCCWRCAISTAVPPTFYPHTPTPGRGPVLPGRTCARALTHTRGRSPAYVPNQRRRAVPRRFPVLCSLA
jgi:hypothetical protein